MSLMKEAGFCEQPEETPARGAKNPMPPLTHIEKFPMLELQQLRDGLLQNSLDSWQAAELLAGFLSGRGYGVSRQGARDAVIRFDHLGHSIDCIQAELEKLAMVM